VDGVASVGTRPTFDLCKPLLEVHLFDFDEEIYGEYIHVDFLAYLRPEEKFASADELVAQMDLDAENARAALAALCA
jgi:riboflavin kinase/FMN adenylyltransferase